ncbi:MAG: hypothetical protein ACP5Q0_06295 [Halothiobacillus sp.]
MAAKLSRAAALAWLGIEPWFVRKPKGLPGFKPAAVAQPLSAHARALVAEPARSSAFEVSAEPQGFSAEHRSASASSSDPSFGVASRIDPAPPVPAIREIAVFAAPDAGDDALWRNIQRCISPQDRVLQSPAASAAEARIQINAQAWSLKTLRENAAEKKRLWRFLVGIDI